MARKQIKISRRMLLTWFLLSGLIILLVPHHVTSKFQLGFAHVFSWPLSIGRSISLSAYQQHLPADVVSRQKYIQLENHLFNVQELLTVELDRNEKLCGFRKKHPFEDTAFVFAYIIQSSASELTIGCGENEGLEPGQFVLGDNSIIGTISEVFSATAKVRLITDPSSQIAVKISDEKAILTGDGDNLAKISLLSREHEVKVGDTVFCREKAGFLNCSIIAGTVGRCKRDDNQPLLWDITIRPACDITQINNVNVIVINRRK